MGFHGLSLLAVWLGPLAAWLRLLLAAGVLVSLWLILKSRAGYAGVSQKPDGSWRLHTREGIEIEVRLLGSSMANPWFVLLHLRADSSNRLHTVLICRDSLEPDLFRRLRVALRVDDIG